MQVCSLRELPEHRAVLLDVAPRAAVEITGDALPARVRRAYRRPATKADVDALRTRIAALDAAIARLEAELDGGDFVPPDPTNPDGAVQSKLFQQRRGYFKASLNNYDAQIASLEAQLQTNKSEEALTAQRFETLRSIEAMRSELMEAKTGSKLNLLLSRASRLEIEDNLTHMRGDQLDLTHKLEKTRSERQVFIQDFGRTALQDLVDTLTKRNAAAESMTALRSDTAQRRSCSKSLIGPSDPSCVRPKPYSRWCRGMRPCRLRSVSIARTSAS